VCNFVDQVVEIASVLHSNYFHFVISLFEKLDLSLFEIVNHRAHSVVRVPHYAIFGFVR